MTQAKIERAQADRDLLGSLAVALGSTLDYETLLQDIPRLFVPKLAGGCLVSLVEDGRPRTVADFFNDSVRPSIHELQAWLSTQMSDSVLAHVIETGKSAWIEMPVQDAASTIEDGLPHPFRDHALAIPLKERDAVTGVILLVHRGSGFGFEESHLAMADWCGELVSVALRNARQFGALRNALDAQAEMLAMAAHDLKNPLASIKLLSYLLERDAQAAGIVNEKLAQGLQRMGVSVAQASAEADELTEFANLALGKKLRLVRRRFDLVELVAEVVQAQSSAHGRSIQLLAETPSLEGRWDRLRIARALTTFIENGLKYSPPQDTLLVGVRAEETGGRGQAAVSVQDFGIGMPRGDVPHIFERYYRAANAKPRDRFGIGLAGAAAIVKAHGGTVEVESQEGTGSIFVFRLPLERASAERRRLERRNTERVNTERRGGQRRAASGESL